MFAALSPSRRGAFTPGGRRAVRAVVLLAALAGAAALRAEDTQYTWGADPWLGHFTTTSVSVSWITVAATTGVVRYGASADRLDREAKDEVARQVHEVAVTGLQPGTTYFYQARSGDYASPVQTFRTQKPRGDPFSFVVYGDTRSDHKSHARVAELAASLGGEFYLQTGDMVSDGRNADHWRSFFEVETRILGTTPLYPVLGNHEKQSEHYFRFFQLPGNEAFYSFDYGNAHFVMLNSNLFPVVPSRQHEQLQFLRADLEKSDADWVFVAWHHPSFGSQTSRRFERVRMKVLTHGLLKELGVDVAFFGHDHHYVHSLADGLHYVLSGGGGAPLYEMGAPGPEVVHQAKVHHACKIAIDGKRLTFEAFGLDGAVFDRFTLDKRAAPSGEDATTPRGEEEF